MSVIGVNDGHTRVGAGSGAVGIISESEHTRLVGEEVRRLINERGHKAINCTIDKADTASQALALIVAQANRQDLDWFISIHFNAAGGRGVECYTYEGRQYEDAIEVCKNISDLGFINRGVRSGSGLYVIRKTKAKSMLIEVCFVDSEDANHYLSIGHEVIAKAIVDALMGYVEIDVNQTQPIIKEEEEVITLPSNFNEKFYLFANPDVAKAVREGVIVNGATHYLGWGWKEGRATYPFIPEGFNVEQYLKNYPDVAKAIQDGSIKSAESHYIEYGVYEFRSCRPIETIIIEENVNKEELKNRIANTIDEVIK